MKWLYEKYDSFYISSLMRELKLVDWAGTHLRARKIVVSGQLSGWLRIPAISQFNIKLGEFHPLLKLLGLKKRLPARLEFETLGSKKAQRFMEHSLRRLEKVRSNPKLYWIIADSLMKRSASFRTAAINKVFHNWYKDYSFWFIMNVNRKCTNIINNRNTELDFKRVYINKANGKLRPLGVPKPEWRLYLHMLNNFLHWFLKEQFQESQHGFLPGRGTMSAWKEIFEKDLLEKAWIYECDLRDWFNRVELLKLSDILKAAGVPDWINERLYMINMCVPNMTQEKLPEDRIKAKKWLRNQTKLDGIGWNHHEWPTSPAPWGAGESFRTIIGGNWLETQLDAAQTDGKIGANLVAFQGLPQGANTSPLLSNLAIKSFVSQQTSVSYADDPIFFGDERFEIETYPETGQEIAEEKSGWIKEAGAWNKPLKFLGLEYNGVNRTLRAQTRNGATLEVQGDHKEMLIALAEWDEKFGVIDSAKKSSIKESSNRALHSWKKIWSSKLAGFMMASMYKDSWKETINQDFELAFGSSSWLGLYKEERKPKWSTFTVSSFACESLLMTLRTVGRKKRAKAFKKVRFIMPPGRPRGR